MIVEARGADLGVVEEAERGPRQRRHRWREGQRLEVRIEPGVEHPDRHVASPLVSTGTVTASDFSAYHGGTTAPNPPAGPPAATTSRSSGVRSAGCTSSALRPTTAALPTPCHSPRRTRARSCTYSRTSRLDQPAASRTSRCWRPITTA